MTECHIYLDSKFLVGILEDAVRKQHDQLRIISKAKNKGIIIIPQIVLGETLSILISDNKNDEVYNKTRKLIDKIIEILDPCTCLHPLKFEIVKHVQEIRLNINKVDSHKIQQVGATDIFIAAQALIDIESTILLTSDTSLLKSIGIRNYQEELINMVVEVKN